MALAHLFPRVCRRPLFPGEPDVELIWGSVLAACALIAGAWLSAGLPTPPCLLHAMTGIPCPTCGMTRGIGSLLHGNFLAAALFNPLLAAVLTGCVAYIFYSAAVVIGGLPRVRVELPSRAASRVLRLAVAILFGMNWIYLILREQSQR